MTLCAFVSFALAHLQRQKKLRTDKKGVYKYLIFKHFKSVVHINNTKKLSLCLTKKKKLCVPLHKAINSDWGQ
jgi:hypothetical protein